MLNTDVTTTVCGLDNLVIFPASKRYDQEGSAPASEFICPSKGWNALFAEELQILRNRLVQGESTLDGARVWLNMLRQSNRMNRELN